MDQQKLVNARLREEAQAAGQKRYSTGTPCARGHTAQRYTINGACIDCQHKKVKEAPNAVRRIETVIVPVAIQLTEEETVVLHNWLLRCAESYHQQLGVEFPFWIDRLRWAEQHKRRVKECPF